MRVTVLAFARLRDLLGVSRRDLDLPDGALARDAWEALAREVPSVAPLRASTRVARNGAVIEGDARLCDGDELALLPPAGGG